MQSKIIEEAQARDPEQGRRAEQTVASLQSTMVQRGPLVDLLQVDEHDPDAVAKVLRRSPTLATRLLSVLNSAAFGLSRPVISINRAVMLLGPGRARSIALAHGLKMMAESQHSPGRLVELLWINSIRKACAARELAERIDSSYVESAYSLGLVQDIGLPGLIGLDPAFYEQMIDSPGGQDGWLEAEQAHFGVDHARLGQLLLQQWKAPEPLQLAVGQHHQPPGEEETEHGGSGLRLGSFIASLLPHLDEKISPVHRGWLEALHAKFLRDAWQSIDAFLLDVDGEAHAMAGQIAREPEADDDPAVMRQLIDRVADDTVSIVANLCQLEAYLDRERRRLADNLNELRSEAYTDPVTRVLNRRGFAILSQHRLQAAARDGQGVCVMMMDLDDFKGINDEFGHANGDQALRGVAKLLRRSFRRSDLIARVGGDEFTVLVSGIEEEDARNLARSVLQRILGRRVLVEPGVDLRIYVSLGVYHVDPVPADATVESLLKEADKAMYQRKRSGKRGLTFITAGKDEPAPAEEPAA